MISESVWDRIQTCLLIIGATVVLCVAVFNVASCTIAQEREVTKRNSDLGYRIVDEIRRGDGK